VDARESAASKSARISTEKDSDAAKRCTSSILQTRFVGALGAIVTMKQETCRARLRIIARQSLSASTEKRATIGRAGLTAASVSARTSEPSGLCATSK